MREILTKKEYELYKYIKDNKIFNTTYTDLAKRLNVSSIGTIRDRILSLQKKGYLIRSGTLIQLIQEWFILNKDNHTKLKIYDDEIPYNYSEKFFSCPSDSALKLLDLLKEKTIKPIDLRLYLFLCATCEMATQKCPYTVPQIAEKLEIDESNLRKSVYRLQDAKIILVGCADTGAYYIFLSPRFASMAPKLKKDMAERFELYV